MIASDNNVHVGGRAIAPLPFSENSPESRLRARLNALEAPANAWQPEPGDELVGRFVGWTERTTRRNETHPVALVETSAGETFAVWAFYRVLRDELHRAAPKPGETILIRRGEDRTGPNGPYRVYRVAVDRDDPHQGAPRDWTLAEGGAR